MVRLARAKVCPTQSPAGMSQPCFQRASLCVGCDLGKREGQEPAEGCRPGRQGRDLTGLAATPTLLLHCDAQVRWMGFRGFPGEISTTRWQQAQPVASISAVEMAWGPGGRRPTASMPPQTTGNPPWRGEKRSR